MNHDMSGATGETKMSGRIVTRVKDTIFIPLPRGLWKEIEGGCACPYCSGNGKSQSPAYWDTLAVAKNGKGLGHSDYTYTVHYPQLNGGQLKPRAI